MNVKRCQGIASDIADKLFAIRSELNRPQQYGYYLMEKLSSIIWDANVLKTEFEELQKEQEMKEGE